MRSAAPLVLLLVLAGCTDGTPRDGAVAPSGSTTSAAPQSTTLMASPTTGGQGTGQDGTPVGRWETDLTSFTRAADEVVCSGPVHLDLDPGGAFAASAEPRCTRRGVVVSTSTRWSGTWRADGQVLAVDGSPGEVEVTVDGVPAPLGPLRDLTHALTTSVGYRVDGDRLLLGPLDGSGAEVALRRAG
ncbi:hypothetical protein [Thalassiella azotivora]